MRVAIGITLGTATLLLLATGLMLVAHADSPAKPVLTLYTADGEWCQHCNRAKRELAAAKDPPFTVEVQTKHPAWVTLLPVSVWETPDGPRKVTGWPGLPRLLTAYRSTLIEGTE